MIFGKYFLHGRGFFIFFRAVHYIWAMVRDIDRKEEKESSDSEQSKETYSSWKLMEMVVRTSYSTI